MGQSSSKGPKQSPKRGSVQAEATTTKNVQRTIFDHVIEQIVEKSKQHVPGATGESDTPIPVTVHEQALVDFLFTLPTEVDGQRHLQKLGVNWFQKEVQKGGDTNNSVVERPVLLKACERLHGIIDEQLALSTYVYLYSDSKQLMSREVVREFMELSLFLYLLDSWNSEEEPANGGPSSGHDQVQSVLDALFNGGDGNESRDARHVLKYIENNLPNCAQHIHKFVLYRLVKGPVLGGVFTNRVLLERNDVDPSSYRPLLTKYKLWQLSSILPVVPYFKAPLDKTQPQAQSQPQPQSSAPSSRRPSYYMSAPFGKDNGLTIANWQMLYNSDAHGVGTNRFTHHVLGYRGPTVMLILAKDPKTSDIFEFVFASAQEWRESMSTPYVDKMGCAAEIRHQFRCLARAKATAWIYYNMGTQRGLKKGLVLGETGEPTLFTLDESFDNATYDSRSLHVLRIEVWGCGTAEERARQLDVKKWQIKEAEKQRVVKLSADDWLDHPDRYLLEMSGRQSYVTQKEGAKKK